MPAVNDYYQTQSAFDAHIMRPKRCQQQETLQDIQVSAVPVIAPSFVLAGHPSPGEPNVRSILIPGHPGRS